MGFVFPFEKWLRTDLRDYCEDLFSEERIERVKVLDPEEVARVWRGFLDGTGPYNYSSILCLISFVNWYERNIAA